MTVGNRRSVLIMAGGTGGHVFPALATADSLRAMGVHVEWLGTTRGIEARLVPEAGIPIHYLAVSGLRGKNIFHVLKGLFNVVGALVQAMRVLKRLRPICVLGMGGFVAGPGGLAAWLLRRPLVIHEQNAVAGTTNKLLAPLAKKVLQGYPLGLGGKRARYVGNPVREDIVRIPSPEQRGVGRSGRLRLLVLGGSLGARPINEAVPSALAAMAPEQRPLVKHQTGKAHLQAVAEAYRCLGVEADVSGFIDDMALAYRWADIVICRAGALTVAELSAVGVASILVPLPHAIDDHQTSNARWLSENQAAELLIQNQMTGQRLAELLLKFDRDRDALLAMAQACRALAKPDAARQVAEICLEVGRD